MGVYDEAPAQPPTVQCLSLKLQHLELPETPNLPSPISDTVAPCLDSSSLFCHEEIIPQEGPEAMMGLPNDSAFFSRCSVALAERLPYIFCSALCLWQEI